MFTAATARARPTDVVLSVRILLLCAASCLSLLHVPSCLAFQPSRALTSNTRTRTRLFSTTSSTNEFDYILREGEGEGGGGKAGLNMPTTRRSRFVVSIGGRQQSDHGKVLLVSSVAVPNMAADAAEAMASLDESSSETTATTSASDDPYDSAFDAQMNKIQQYQEKQQTPATDKLKSMDLQDIILTLIVPAVLVFAAGRWGYNKVSAKVIDKTDATLDRFATEMLFHDGDFDEMKMCVADYNSKLVYLGPLKRDKMLTRYLANFAKRKTISPQAISSLSYVFTLFNLSEESAAKILVTTCRIMGTDKISSAGKLLFLGSRILKSPQGVQALQPIKDMIKSTYREGEAAVADTMVDTSQQAIAEASYRTTVQNAGKNQETLSNGWQVLGLDQATAQRIWKEEAKEGFMSMRETMYGGQTQKYDKKGHRLKKDGSYENPAGAKKANDNGDEDDDTMPTSNVYECGDCGFTLFVAQGRESKFFGQNFKCPECGAPKKKFKARDMDDEDDE